MQHYIYSEQYIPSSVDKQLGSLVYETLTNLRPSTDPKTIDNLFHMSSFNRNASAIILTVSSDSFTIRHISTTNLSDYKLSDSLHWLRRHRHFNFNASKLTFQIDLISNRSELMSWNFVLTGQLLGSSDFKPGIDGLVVFYNFKTHYILPSDFSIEASDFRESVMKVISNAVNSTLYKKMIFRRIRSHAFKFENSQWRTLNESIR